MTAKCPECGTEIQLPEDTEVGDIIVCDECDVELEVVSLEPPELEVLVIEK